MSQTLEIELDDIHELMLKEIGDDDLDPEEWAQETLTSILYQSYKNQ